MGLGLALNPMTGILKSRPREEMNRDTGKMPGDNGGTDWSVWKFSNVTQK